MQHLQVRAVEEETMNFTVGLSQRERAITVKRIPAVPSAVNFADYSTLCI